MFPFAMQAKLAEAWFEAAAAGFAMAGSMGTAAARSLHPWLPGAPRPSYAFGSWGPVLNPAWPWSWLAGFGPQASWYQWPMSFYGDWTRAFSYGAPSNGWLASPRAWTTFPQSLTYSAFLMPFAQTSQPYFPVSADPSALFAASYRTASGHATAAMFDALMPRTVNWATAPWKLSPVWMLVR